ncbi:hypothetical protein [Oceanobacillus jeddahense]|uniref:Uncharacterized protein n=1 Tax=Oceanobacillus jeddahense TaxID=1462527 RepID=A0ABY5JNF9_9BACI|nr:hypothetical protein [Oceanobacillus jeddahense]UUI01851.1 hypothetical protein NP439_17600 [Oceanobacillus jeddahense]
MKMNKKLLKSLSLICGTLITIGAMMFIYGYLVSAIPIVTAVGIGLAEGGTFIFIMGLFLVAVEENFRGKKHKHEQS